MPTETEGQARKKPLTFLQLCALMPREFSPIETVKIIDNIEITIEQEVDEGGNLYEPLLKVFAIFKALEDDEIEEEIEVYLAYEGELWGWQPL